MAPFLCPRGWDAVAVACALFTGLLFFAEVLHFLSTGIYAPHVSASGLPYRPWSQPLQNNPVLSVHTAACYLWLVLAVHQVLTRGKGLHAPAGYAAAALGSGGILLANLRAAVTIPAVHTIIYQPLFDWALHLAWLSLTSNLVKGILAARRGQVKDHANYMRDAIVVTAAPAFYRLFVMLLVALANLPDQQDVGTSCSLACIHEAGILLATFVCKLLFRAEAWNVFTGAHMVIIIVFIADAAFVGTSGMCYTTREHGGQSVAVPLFSHSDEAAARHAAARFLNVHALGIDWR